MTNQPPADKAALEAQQDLLESCLEAVFAAYDEAVEDGIIDPVVILLDCEDDIGRQIAEGWLGRQAVDDAVAEQLAATSDRGGTDNTTVFARAFAWSECCDQVPMVFPYLAPVFAEKNDQEGFLAISVTSGGASALTVPDAARD